MNLKKSINIFAGSKATLVQAQLGRHEAENQVEKRWELFIRY